jgi:hypothetical protein
MFNVKILRKVGFAYPVVFPQQFDGVMDDVKGYQMLDFFFTDVGVSFNMRRHFGFKALKPHSRCH